MGGRGGRREGGRGEAGEEGGRGKERIGEVISNVGKLSHSWCYH